MTKPRQQALATEAEAAHALDRDTRTIRRWRSQGAPHVLIARDGSPKPFYELAKLRAWAAGRGLFHDTKTGPKPRRKSAAAPAAARQSAPTRREAPTPEADADPGRPLDELERVLASGGVITDAERERLRDLLNLRRARREKGKAAMAAVAVRAQRAGLVDLALVNARLLRGAAAWRKLAAEMARTRGQAWLDDALDLLDSLLAEALPGMHTPTQSPHPDAAR